MRVQVTALPQIGDGRAHATGARLETVGYPVASCRVGDVYLLAGVPGLTSQHARELFGDPVAQRVRVDGDLAPHEEDDPTPAGANERAGATDAAGGPPATLPWDILVEVGSRPGVADPVASSIRDALTSELGRLPSDTVVQTARQYFVALDPERAHAHRSDLAPRIAGELHNPLIEHAVVITRGAWDAGERPPEIYPTVADVAPPPVERIDVASMGDAELEHLSAGRLLALTLPEMRAIREHYADPQTRRAREACGLGPLATDVELELIAQTWSEHCKHKIFAARVEYREGDGEVEVIDSLFRTYIQATTERVADPAFVKSVFDDNAGVVAFDEEWLLCFKAETHNSPSALDPYGGAITGIVGVNRDILGTGKGARPLFNTDVLCFGYPETPADELPEGLLHPRVVLDGVHRGIVDGGNQSGIPTAAGAFLFDESYTGKPLVFCGTGGLLPARINGEEAWVKHIDPGDVAVMVGGLIGKDGIHGATFSSLALDEASPTSAVQIGEPITQKKMADFLLEARDLGLYKGITDNGAGGLSSSFGEMARDAGGVRIDLDGCPLKYEGLAAWEIFVSESQERMSLAVDPEHIDALLALARRRGVVASVVGEFTASGLIEVSHRGETVASLGLEFVHDGLPQMVIPARWPAGAPGSPGTGAAPGDDSGSQGDPPIGGAETYDRLLALLRDPNIGSKEHLVRQYDHEVQGGSVVKPHCGRLADAPSDGAVLRPRPDSWRGITVTHGICPRRGDADTYDMAVAAVDEAVRAHVALGGDPERMAALDNFCWPDPVLSDATPDGPYKMAQLVRACRGLADACVAYRLPLVSGKDSMKNDANLGGRKVSIRPTLLVSLTGIVPDARDAMTTDFKRPGDRILVVGEAAAAPARRAPAAPSLERRFELYRRLHAAIARGLCTAVHDVSDGGLAVALAESAIGGRLGARVDVSALSGAAGDGAPAPDPRSAALFGEPGGSFVVTCDPASLADLAQVLDDAPWVDLGEVVADPALVLTDGESEARWTIDELVDAWKSLARGQGAQTEPRTVDEGGGAAGGRVGSPRSGPSRAGSVGPGEARQHARAAVSSRGARPPGAPTALILTGYGINADRELAAAFALAGARVDEVHLNDLLADRRRLERADIFAVPGGFSYGDHVGSGRMLAHRLQELRAELDAFRGEGGLVLGICNGFQALVKLGLLPDLGGRFAQEVSLVHNASGLFEDSWVTVEFDPACRSPWLSGLDRLDVPIRHGEGRFVTLDASVLGELEERRLVAARYANRNPNGSQGSIAGIVDTTGNVLGMMPHPEAYLVAQNHPHWRDRPVDPDGGLALFRNAVHAAREAKRAR